MPRCPNRNRGRLMPARSPRQFSRAAASGAWNRISKCCPVSSKWNPDTPRGGPRNPSYREVSAGHTGHTEAIRVIYDPQRISYPQLVGYFWRHIDPTVKDQQFCDVGPQYRSGIYWQNEAEREVAETSREMLLRSGRFRNIYTELAPASMFWRAEEYHQDYYRKNPLALQLLPRRLRARWAGGRGLGREEVAATLSGLPLVSGYAAISTVIEIQGAEVGCWARFSFLLQPVTPVDKFIQSCSASAD